MSKAWQTIQGLLALGQGAWKILGLVGWQHLTVAFVASLAGGLLAHLQGVPTSLAFLAAFPVFVACLYLLKLPAFIAGTDQIEGQRLPKNDLWRRVDRYALGQAACLMAGVQPVVDPAFMPKSAVPYYELIHQGARNGAIAVHTPNLPAGQDDPVKTGQSPPSWYHVVLRGDLKKYWESQEFPQSKFLQD